MHFCKAATVALTLLAFTGCTTMRLVEERSPESIQQHVARGDDVRIAASDGKVYELHVTQVEAESLTGTAANGKRYKVHYSGIRALEVEEVSVLGTLAGGVGTLAVVGTVALAIALHNLDIHFGICE
jgi:hypothetical protein